MTPVLSGPRFPLSKNSKTNRPCRALGTCCAWRGRDWGHTQKDASKRLGIDQPLLSRFENSVSEPDDAFLMKAGRVYDMPRSFFEIRETIYGPPVSVHTMLRGKADVTAREVDLIAAELNIRVMHLRRLLEGVDFVPTSDIPSLDVEQFGPPEKIAATARAPLGRPKWADQKPCSSCRTRWRHCRDLDFWRGFRQRSYVPRLWNPSDSFAQ